VRPLATAVYFGLRRGEVMRSSRDELRVQDLLEQGESELVRVTLSPGSASSRTARRNERCLSMYAIRSGGSVLKVASIAPLFAPVEATEPARHREP
jgi:hypothetical protein